MLSIIKEIFEILITAIFELGIPLSKAMLDFKMQVEEFLQIFKINKSYTICIAIFFSISIIIKIIRIFISNQLVQK